MWTVLRFTQNLTVLFLLARNGIAFQPRYTLRSSYKTQFSALDLASSKKTSGTDASYLTSRGDGSTGGGGLPMPKQGEGTDGDLVRPKVTHNCT